MSTDRAMNESWAGLIDGAVALRHRLHQQPELAWAEHQTAQTIRDELDQAGINWRACADTGTIATLGPERGKRHIALRADIDALPIAEQTGLSYTSKVEGCMHACGHDGHTATLIAVARWLKQHEDVLQDRVSLFFQPAEEGGHGAKRMIDDGALQGVDAIFGWHNWPGIKFGKALCPDGPVMAGNGTFGITVHGQGGHASQPEVCRDPVLAASAITLAIQQIVSRRLAPQHAAVVSITSINAPSFDTIIPDTAQIGGSIRIADTHLRDTVNDLIVQTAQDTARAYGTTAEVEIRPRYDATVNDPVEATNYRHALADEFGEDWCDSDHLLPLMASEDFSYYLQQIPGAFAIIGADDGEGHHVGCHSARYDFNDALIPHVARVFARLAGATLPQ